MLQRMKSISHSSTGRFPLASRAAACLLESGCVVGKIRTCGTQRPLTSRLSSKRLSKVVSSSSSLEGLRAQVTWSQQGRPHIEPNRSAGSHHDFEELTDVAPSCGTLLLVN